MSASYTKMIIDLKKLYIYIYKTTKRRRYALYSGMARDCVKRGLLTCTHIKTRIRLQAVTVLNIPFSYNRGYQPDLCLTYFFDLRREQGACSSERSRSSVTKSSVRVCVCICVVLYVRVRRASLSCVFMTESTCLLWVGRLRVALTD